MLENHNTQSKISFFLPNLGDGGLTKITLLLVNNFADRGHDVDLIMSSKVQPEHLNKLIAKNVNVVQLNSSRTITSLIPLVNYLKKHKPKALLSGGPAVNSVSILAKILAKSDAKVILTEHSMPSFDVLKSGKAMSMGIKSLMKRLYPKADHIVAVSNAVARDLSTFINQPCHSIKVIYNPIVSTNLIEKSYEKIDYPWLVENTYPVIIYVGRLVVMKNIALIIRAFFLLNKSVDAKLLIIGEGPEKSNLVKLINSLALHDKVKLIGYQENPYKYMRLADVLVLASEWEGLPTVLIESMAFDTPVIATNNLEGAIEIIDKGKFGLLSDSDKESLAAAMMSIVNRTETFDNLVERSEDFSVEASIDEYEKLIG